jgi:DNA-directed RNA polymerase sigma subunit (sigma70/sigma32)
MIYVSKMHPNMLAAVRSPRARRLNKDKKASARRTEEILKLREEKKTYAEIGRMFEISRERVRQLIKKHEYLKAKKEERARSLMLIS